MDSNIMREVNVRIHDVSRGWDELADYLCECGHPTCLATRVEVHPREFADIEGAPGAVLVALGHQEPGFEIVRAEPTFLVVRRIRQIV